MLNRRRVFVIGDLVVDFVVRFDGHGAVLSGSKRAGGTAVNAALAMQEEGFEPVVIGAIGTDEDGEFLQSYLRRRGISSELVRNESPTGACAFIHEADRAARRFNPVGTANAVDPASLTRLLREQSPSSDDLVFVATHLLVRRPVDECRRFFEKLREIESRVIIDLLPHDLPRHVTGEAVESCLSIAPFALIAELPTIRGLFGKDDGGAPPTLDDWRTVFTRLGPTVADLRYGRLGIEFQSVATARSDGIRMLEEHRPTEFMTLSPEQRIGFGDRLTARLLRRLS